MKYPNPKVTGGLERSWKQGKCAAVLAFDKIAWKDKTAGSESPFLLP